MEFNPFRNQAIPKQKEKKEKCKIKVKNSSNGKSIEFSGSCTKEEIEIAKQNLNSEESY